MKVSVLVSLGAEPSTGPVFLAVSCFNQIAYAELPLLLLFAACLRWWRPCLSASRFAGVSILVGANVSLALLALSSPSSLGPTSKEVLSYRTSLQDPGTHRGEVDLGFHSTYQQQGGPALLKERDQRGTFSSFAVQGRGKTGHRIEEERVKVFDLPARDSLTGDGLRYAEGHANRTAEPAGGLQELAARNMKVKDGGEGSKDLKSRADDFRDEADDSARKARALAVSYAIGALFYSVLASESSWCQKKTEVC